MSNLIKSFLPKRPKEKLRVAVFCPKVFWDRKMSQGRKDSILAISRRPDVELHVSG